MDYSIDIERVRELLKIVATGKDWQKEAARAGLIAVLKPQGIPNLATLPFPELVCRVIMLESQLGGIVDEILESIKIQDSIVHSAARAIMGNNFFGLPEVSQVFGSLTRELRHALAAIQFDVEMLSRCCDTHRLVADIGQVSLIDMYPQLVFRTRQKFATHTEKPAWRLIRMVDATSKTFVAQQELLEFEEVLTARQLMYAMGLIYGTAGRRLLDEGTRARTASVSRRGYRVCIDDGMRIHLGYSDRKEYPNLAIAAAIKHL